MASWQAKHRDPLFDQNTQAALERRGKELAGAGLIVLGVLVAMMLGSWSAEDPSFLSATDAPAMRVMKRPGSWSSEAPLRNSTTPPGVFKSQGLRSHGSVVVAWRRSERASRSTADTVAALESFALSRADPARAAASRQIIRARSKACSVSSRRQNLPDQVSHCPQPAT